MHGPRVLTSNMAPDLAVAEVVMPGCESALRAAITSRTARVAVIGMGYVGLPLALRATSAGFPTLGFDISAAKGATINAGQSPIGDVSEVELETALEAGFSVSHDPASLADCDVAIIAVPTPLTRTRVPDLGPVVAATQTIARHAKPGTLICLESTTYPGTTDEVLLPILQAAGFELDRDVFLAFSPERVDPGNARFKTETTPKVVGGVSPTSGALAEAFYQTLVEKVVAVEDARTAEMVKIFENTFRAVNVGLVNELTLLCDRMGLDVWNVLDAAFTKPFGIMPFYPGPGVGGHCIPLDPHYLEYKAREFDFETRFINIAGDVNRSMPRFVVEKATRILNQEGVPVPKASILVLGVAYKRDQSDCREAPSLEIIDLLRRQGADVRYADPHVPSISIGNTTILAEPLDEASLHRADLVILATDHRAFDLDQVASEAKTVLDTRNALKRIRAPQARIVRL